MIKGKVTKKIITSVLAFCMIFSTSVTANAQSNEDSIKNNIEEIADEYGYEIVEVGETQNIKEVDSLEEIESYLQAFDELSNTTMEETVSISEPIQIPKNMLSLNSVRGAVQSKNKKLKKYNPFAGFDGLTILCWNVSYINYSYKFVNGNPRFVSLNSEKSYLSGVKLTTWEEDGYDYSFSKTNTYNDTLNLTIDGSYVLGFEFKGLCLGARRSGTWKFKLNLVK